MARYRGTVEGNRTQASRLGTAKSGLRVTANGWEIGARVELSPSTDERDYVTIYLTAGSNGSQGSVKIGQYTRADLDAMNKKCASGETAGPDCFECTDCGRCKYHGAPCKNV